MKSQKYFEDYAWWIMLAPRGNCILIERFITRAFERALLSYGVIKSFGNDDRGLSIYLRHLTQYINQYECRFFCLHSY
jgi:hypothetical protein